MQDDPNPRDGRMNAGALRARRGDTQGGGGADAKVPVFMNPTRQRAHLDLLAAALNGIMADHQDIDCVQGKTCPESVAVYANDVAALTLLEYERRYGMILDNPGIFPRQPAY